MYLLFNKYMETSDNSQTNIAYCKCIYVFFNNFRKVMPADGTLKWNM